MDKRDFEAMLSRALYYYSLPINDGNYDAVMDDLACECTDEQWEQVRETFNEVDRRARED